MTYVEISFEDFKAKLLADIKNQSTRGAGVRTTECSDNGEVVSRLLGGDAYEGKDCRMPKGGSGWAKKAVLELVDEGALQPHTEGSYCWLVPTDGTYRVASYIKPTDRVWDLW